MTEKQIKILDAALKLFATEGYAATSTSRVAKTAGVSEGLIFRHFQNKEGLLKAILDQAMETAKGIMADVVMSSDPKEVIRKALELPFNIDPSTYETWRLTYALKWQTDSYDASVQEPLKLSLRNAFNKLGYKDPDAEVEIILMYIDGAATSFLLHPPSNKNNLLKTLKSKYNV